MDTGAGKDSMTMINHHSNPTQEEKLEMQGQDVQKLILRRQATSYRKSTIGVDEEDGEKAYDPAASQKGFQAHPVKAIKVSLEWENLSYEVLVGRGKKKAPKTILHPMSGAVHPGSLLAVMGPTGSGKTSLINALAGRLQASKGAVLSGAIHINGQDRRTSSANITAYVMQDDILLGILTVRETFNVAAQLRLPPSVTAEQKSDIVDAIINELGLAKAQHTRIGNAFVRGVSGGERKRVAFGQALLGNPSLVFADEPTSGLDAFQAQNIMSTLWKLAKGGRTVVATIHQPRSSIYSMFDLLLLLSEGRLLYFGPARGAVDHFERCCMTCPTMWNPADFMLDVVSVDNKSPTTETACHERIKLLSQVFEQDSHLYQVENSMPPEDMHGLPDKFSFATDWFSQYAVLQKRAITQVAREKVPLIIQFVQMIVIGVVLGALYINMDKSFRGIADRTGLLFFIAIGVAFGNMLAVVNVFPKEKAMVFRERSAKSYRVSAYFIAKIIADQPIRVLSLILYAAIVYWMAGLNPSAAAFFKFFIIIFLEATAAGGLGLALSAACKSVDVANALAPALTIILILFGGFYANSATIPAAIRWIRYISHLYWAFMSMSTNEFRGTCCWACSPGAGPNCVITGNEIANDQLSFAQREYWEGAVALLGLTCFWNLLGYWLLRRGMPKFMTLNSDGQSNAAGAAAGTATAGTVNGGSSGEGVVKEGAEAPPRGGVAGWLHSKRGHAAEGKGTTDDAPEVAAHAVVASPAL